MKKLILVLLLSLAIFGNLFAKELRYQSGLKITLSQSSVISMITTYPGNAVYSLFGHSAIRVLDNENGIDWMYNYGTFNFRDKFFVLKFVKGQLDYYLDVTNFKDALYFYSLVENRKVFEQVFNFDLAQRQALFDFLQNNAEPQNMVYRYDFVYDNCSTRVASAIQKVFPGALDYSSYKNYEETFRQGIRGHLSKNQFTDLGIEIVLGSKLDKVPAGNEIFFLPIIMKNVFSDTAFKTGSANAELPLVKKEKILFAPVETTENKNNPVNIPFLIFSIFLFCYADALIVIFALTKTAAFTDKRKPAKARAGITLAARAATIFLKSCKLFTFFATGIMGLLISYLWFFSDHLLTVSNFNLLWCNPLNLVLFFWVCRKKPKRSVFAGWTNIACAVMIITYFIAALLGKQYVLAAFIPIVIILFLAELEAALKFILKKNN